MGLTSAVHWWEESQMRVLVLTSLVIQFLLYIFSVARSYAIHRLFRFIMWIAYLAGDAVAIYALATLFNRHKDQHRGGGSTLELEVFWAPILLLHLGGPDGLTAYNIEDNELWSRHLLTAVSQVTVAIYVFSKSWPPGGDKRLLQASILLFVPGVLKCFTKPFALKRASITSLVSSPAAKRTANKGQAGEVDPDSLEKYVERANAFVQEPKENGDHPTTRRGKQNKDEMDPFEEYVKWKRDFVVGEPKGEGGAQGERAPMEEDTKPTGEGNERRRERILRREANKLFVDLSSPYAGRLSIFKYFWVLSQDKAETTPAQKAKEEQEGDRATPSDSKKKKDEQDKANTAYVYVRRGLASAFLLLYTKLKTAGGTPMRSDLKDEGYRATKIGFGFLCRQWIEISRMILPWAAIGLFHQSHREAYNGTDTKITYAILCCTAVLELYSIISVYYTEDDRFSTADAPFYIISRERWPEVVAQYSLLRYFARNKNHGKLMWVASKLGCRDLLDRHWYMESCSSSRIITELVLGYLRYGWEEEIRDVASYLRFNGNRGHWALEGHKHELGWSIKAPFDESVLLWHITTDFCFFLRTPPRSSSGEQPTSHKPVHCRQMSNYMVYLLFVNPEMLLPGARRNLFTAAYDEIKDIPQDNKPSLFATAYKEVKDILMDNRQNVYRRVKNAMKELKDIFADNKRNPISWSQWNPEPVKEEGVIERVIGSILDNSVQASEHQESTQKFITDAWDLSQRLLALGDDEMWKVIQGVWVEMLCFSASRCRGYLHAKALGSGGEFLSYVWLLLFYMGMETFTERLQREELSSMEANNNDAPSPSDAHNGNATTSSSTSWIRSRAAPSASHLHTSGSESHIVDMHGLTSGARGS